MKMRHDEEDRIIETIQNQKVGTTVESEGCSSAQETYYFLGSSRLDYLSEQVFIRSSWFEGFSSLVTNKVRNLIVNNSYFQKF